MVAHNFCPAYTVVSLLIHLGACVCIVWLKKCTARFRVCISLIVCVCMCKHMLVFASVCVISGHFTEPNSISARAGVVVPAGNRFGSVNPPKNSRGYQEMGGMWFRIREI